MISPLFFERIDTLSEGVKFSLTVLTMRRILEVLSQIDLASVSAITSLAQNISYIVVSKRPMPSHIATSQTAKSLESLNDSHYHTLLLSSYKPFKNCVV